MEEWVLHPGEKPYRILITPDGESFEGLRGMRVYSKIKENGLIDCVLIYDYDERRAVRQARDFPPDQFEHFINGVQRRCPLTCQITDGIQEERLAISLWESFVGSRLAIAAGQ